MPRLDENGHETLDDTPVAIPVGWKKPLPLAEQVRRLVRTAISEKAAEHGFETFEESEDFDVDDDFDPHSPWEQDFDTEMQVQDKLRELKDKKRQLQEERPISQPVVKKPVVQAEADGVVLPPAPANGEAGK